MGKLDKREIRMTPALWESLYEVSNRVFADRMDDRGDRSALVREAADQLVNAWRISPYICDRGRYFVYVNRFGDLFYRTEEVLHLNAPRQFLPCSLEQKLEKQEYYLRNRPSVGDVDEWLRQRWLFNHFAVWDGAKPGTSPPLSKHVDEVGIFRKMADLPVGRQEGAILSREMMLGLTDYAQWIEDDRRSQMAGRDRSGVMISVPTKDMSFVAMIDEGLFDGIRREDRKILPLKMELRNGENARFSDAALHEMKGASERPFEVVTGSTSEDLHRHSRGSHFDGSECRRLLRSFTTRVGEIGLGSKEEASRSRDAILNKMKEPEHFLYCQIKWPLPPIGIDVCISWEKVPKRSIRK